MASAFTLVPTLKDIKSLDDARKMLTEITKSGKFSMTGAKRLVSIHRKMTRMAFSQQEDPDTGEKWAEPRKRTMNDSRFKGLLLRSKSLYKSATKPDVSYKTEEATVLATVRMPGSPPYAEFQQFGTSSIGRENSWAGPDIFVNNSRKTVETVYRRNNGIPARPFFAFARDNFSNKQVSKDIEDTLQVIFDSISNSFEKKALSLPADEIEGYQSIVSFYTRQGAGVKYVHAGMHHGVSTNQRTEQNVFGRDRMVFTGVRARGRVAREANIGTFSAIRTLTHRPPIKSRRSDARSARYAAYMQKKKNYEMHMKELRMELREQYAALLRRSDEMAMEELKLRAQNLKDTIDGIRAIEGMSNDDKMELIIQARTVSLISFNKAGQVDTQKTLRRLREQLIIVEARKLRADMREIARERAGYKLRGRKADPPEVKAQKHAEQLAKRRAEAAASAEERRQRRRKINELVASYYGENKNAVPVKKDIIQRFYERATDKTFPIATAMYEKAKRNAAKLGKDAYAYHATEYRKAEQRIKDIETRRVARNERRLRELQDRLKALKAAGPKPKKTKEPKEPGEAKEPKPRTPRASNTMQVKQKGPELSDVEKTENAALTKRLKQLRSAAKAMRDSGNTEMAEVIEAQSKSIAATRHKRTTDVYTASDAQQQAAHGFRRRTDQLKATLKQVRDLKTYARDSFATARRQSNFEAMKQFDAEAKRLSDLGHRIESHIDLLSKRWLSLKGQPAPASGPVLGPPNPHTVTAKPKKPRKPRTTATASTPKPKKSPKK
jgi:hypothetical protein